MEDASDLKAELLGVEGDGLVQILGDHAGMLEISGECGHGLAHDVLLHCGLCVGNGT